MNIGRNQSTPPSTDYGWIRLNENGDITGYLKYNDEKWVVVRPSEFFAVTSGTSGISAAEIEEILENLATVATTGDYSDLTNTPQEIFVANYDVTSFADLERAYNADKLLFCSSAPLISVDITNNTLNKLTFAQVTDTNNLLVYTINRENGGSYTTTLLESTENKVTSISNSSTDTQYPSAKAVVDYVDEHGGGSSDPEAVKYTQQTLTEEQKAQARQNIGVDSSSVNPVVGFSTPAPPDGTIIAEKANGDTETINLNHNHPQYYSKVAETSIPSGGILPDVVYNLGTLTGSVSFSLVAAVQGNVNCYFWMFSTGSTAPTVTWPSGITWVAGSAPTIAANKKYEISILDGVAVYLEV